MIPIMDAYHCMKSGKDMSINRVIMNKWVQKSTRIRTEKTIRGKALLRTRYASRTSTNYANGAISPTGELIKETIKTPVNLQIFFSEKWS